jgi:hypothetical protein
LAEFRQIPSEINGIFQCFPLIPSGTRHFCQHLSKWIDSKPGLWDNPTMTVTADAKRRVVVPGVKPGDVFARQEKRPQRNSPCDQAKQNVTGDELGKIAGVYP